ncbi:hypothetical protein B0H19DRAFT_1175450 [Mycena capillaripes]|nr:hypothetical protein B0H19DRAFT_1175450 [Mycena capillaripes]
MSTARVRQKRPLKPPACDSCKARRVLCHPQPNGAPCPRCAEKKVVCITTPVIRGRPRKTTKSATPEAAQKRLEQELAVAPQLLQASSSSVTLLSPQVYFDSRPECPNLTPELVAHLLDCFDQLHPVNSPIITATSIKPILHSVSFQLTLLKPEMRVLAMCIIALSSLISSHEAILGPGPLPDSIRDEHFFYSKTDVRNGGIRRVAACRALHAAALKAAWDAGIIIQTSTENAASCYLLDLLEQSQFSVHSRPWASAFVCQLRALAPTWEPSIMLRYSAHWAGFLMIEALTSTYHRKPILFTDEDQILLCGAAPQSAQDFLTSLEAFADKPGFNPLTQAMKPYTFHVIRIARQLWTTITGDHVRRSPLSESAVLQILSSLSLLHAIISRLLALADTIIATSGATLPQKFSFVLGNATQDIIVRRCAYGAIIGFTGLVFPLHRELELRADAGDATSYARTRMNLLRAEAREMMGIAVRELARAIRYFPAIYFDPLQWDMLRDHAQFALDEAAATPVVEPERVRDLATLAGQLRMTTYSLDLQDTASLIDRLDQYIENATHPVQFFDPENILGDLVLPLDQAWMASLSGEIPEI